MQLNYKTEAIQELLPSSHVNDASCTSPVLHFGVGAFHRAHQARALQNLIDGSRVPQFEDWSITGVCILPQDIKFVEEFKKQDCLYFLQSFSPEGDKNTKLISAIREIFHTSTDYEQVLERIAAACTKIISFTITEGGYNVDFNKNTFIWESPAVKADILREGAPNTVFRILAEGLKRRMEEKSGPIVLMSCDNIQHNGDVLKLALLSFLDAFDSSIIPWVEAHVTFAKTMVDRITPAATEARRKDFEQETGIRDNCLVVCENYFQWIIEKHPSLSHLPLQNMGAVLVDEVAPYEKMKLRLLNGGHSLTGLLGYALGYDRIHTAIKDTRINAIFRHYCFNEVIPTLDDITEVRYADYVQELISRFSNPMINDSATRIISGSTDKLPKFIVPVIADQLKQDVPQITLGVLILAAWYYYLDVEFNKNQMQDVIDTNKEILIDLFNRPGWDAVQFADNAPVMDAWCNQPIVKELFIRYTSILKDSGMAFMIEQLLKKIKI